MVQHQRFVSYVLFFYMIKKKYHGLTKVLVLGARVLDRGSYKSGYMIPFDSEKTRPESPSTQKHCFSCKNTGSFILAIVYHRPVSYTHLDRSFSRQPVSNLATTDLITIQLWERLKFFIIKL